MVVAFLYTVFRIYDMMVFAHYTAGCNRPHV